MTETPTPRFSWLSLFLKLMMSGVAVAAVLVGGALYYISLYPVSLSHFKGFIEETINLELDGYRAEFGQGQLVWAGWDRGLDLLVEDLVVYDKDNRAIIRLPDLSVELAAHPLLDGEISPISVDLLDASLNLIRQPDGNVVLGLSKSGNQSRTDGMTSLDEGNSEDQIKAMIAAFDQLPLLKRLREINILNGALLYTDYATYSHWEAANLTATFTRGLQDVSVTLSMDMQVEDYNATLLVDGGLGLNDLNYHGSLRIDDMPLHELMKQAFPDHPEYNVQGLAKTKLELQGNVAGLPESLSLELTSDYGVVSGDVILDAQTNQYKADVNLSVDEPSRLASISKDFADAKRVDFPMAIEMEILGALDGPPEQVAAKFTFDQGQIEIPELYEQPLKLEGAIAELEANLVEKTMQITKVAIDLGENSDLQVTGTIDASAEDISIAAKAVLQNFTMERLPDFWSPKLGTNAQIWVTENIQKGDVAYADIDIALTLGQDGAFKTLDRMGGQLEMDKGTVQYLKGLPVVTNAKATATFGENWFDITLLEGHVIDQSRLQGGRVQITDIGGEDNIDISIDVLGPLTEALELLDHEPLGFVGKLGLKPQQLSGLARTNATFAFPLLNDLKTEEVIVSASAVVDDVKLVDGPYGINAQSEQLSLKVNNVGMDVEGMVTVKNQPLNLVWHESFTSNEEIAQDFKIVGPISVDLMDIFNIPYQGYFEGTAPAAVRYQYRRDGVSLIDVKADVTDSLMRFDQMGWRKKKGREAHIEASLELPKTGGLVVERMLLKGDRLDIRGNLSLASGETWPEALDMPVVMFDKNKLSLSMAREGEYQKIDVTGQYLDVTGLLENLSADETPIDDPSDIQNKEEAEQALLISLSLDQLQMDPVLADQVLLDLDYDGTYFDRLRLRSAFADRAALNADFGEVDGQRILSVVSDNIGAVLQGAKISDRLEGGEMVISGTQDQEGGHVKGQVDIGNFTLVKAPAVTKILEFMSLTGTLSALTSSGLDFTRLNTDFDYNDDRLEFANGRTYGTSLGLTFEGAVDLEEDVLDMRGTAVPVYTVNRILGAIPILGTLLTGGEGGGLFAANYEVDGGFEDPNVSVNPLSALAPSFLKRLFDVATEAGIEREEPLFKED